MVIKVHIPSMLQQITSRDTVEVEGKTVRECTDNLKRKFPDFRDWLDESNPMAWVTMNQKIVGITELDQKVSECDELNIILLLAGG